MLYCASGSLLRRLQIPPRGFGQVGGDTQSLFVEDADVELRGRMPLLGQRKPQLQRRRILAAVVRGNAVLVGTREGVRRHEQEATRETSTQLHRGGNYNRSEGLDDGS